MATTQELEQLDCKYDKIVEKRYGQAWFVPEYYALVCELTDSYVPIEKFKEIFKEMQQQVEGKDVKRFVFDKRNLRVFHQPSMEWYFIEWKKEMYDKGVVEHRKILPDGEDWFKQAVKAGRELIKEKYPDNIIHKLNIVYCSSIEEALKGK